MKLVCGLGNPGSEYADHRHNVGFMVLDLLAQRARLDFTQQKFEARIAQGTVAGEKVLLVKPQTFMNLSGQSVAPAARFYKVEPADIVVVQDELDLPLGRLQIKTGGGAGGHNGIKSIAQQLGDEGFVRIRVGIGKSQLPGEKRGSVVGHVLGAFAKDEQQAAAEAMGRAADAVEKVLRQGALAAMNEFNRK
jgi:PTH1 family peptidyl-tRNA hydrolase